MSKEFSSQLFFIEIPKIFLANFRSHRNLYFRPAILGEGIVKGFSGSPNQPAGQLENLQQLSLLENYKQTQRLEKHKHSRMVRK